MERDWRIFREDHSISFKGSRIPRPFRSWDDAARSMPESILRGVRDAGYKKPSPIQMANLTRHAFTHSLSLSLSLCLSLSVCLSCDDRVRKQETTKAINAYNEHGVVTKATSQGDKLRVVSI